jgi:hypothetical protein
MSGFVPVDPPRLAVASDGTLAAVHEASRITIVELPGGDAFAEVGMDPEAAESELGWVGSPPRLVVLSRFASHSTLYLLDPHGPRTIAEIRLEAAMRLYATVGAHALAVGGGTTAILTATDTHLTPHQFPARSVPTAAGAAGTNFVVALAAAIEEWDPQSRLPKRRLRLSHPAAITALGGSDRVLWLTTQQDPTRIDAIPLVNRGQPKLHELPEPIARISGHPRSDYVACIGAETGQLYVIDLDGRVRRRTIACEGLDRVDAAAIVVGRVTGLLVAQAGKPIALVPLDDAEPRDKPATLPPVSGLGETQPISTLSDPPPKGGAGRSTLGEHAAAEPPTQVTLASHAPEPSPLVTPASLAPEPPPHVRPALTWRDDLVAWARAVTTGTTRPAPSAPAVTTLATRLELAELADALALLYGLHLGGGSVAPVDLARVCGWPEALGRGRLVAVASFADSRVRLAPAVCRALDELPPRSGTLVGEPGAVALLGPCVVVAPEGAMLAPLAARCLAGAGGAILAGRPESEPAELASEARVYGAAPMMRVTDLAWYGAEPVVLVVASDEAAEQLGVPRLTTT